MYHFFFYPYKRERAHTWREKQEARIGWEMAWGVQCVTYSATMLHCISMLSVVSMWVYVQVRG